MPSAVLTNSDASTLKNVVFGRLVSRSVSRELVVAIFSRTGLGYCPRGGIPYITAYHNSSTGQCCTNCTQTFTAF